MAKIDEINKRLRTEDITILLTGASGFIGSRLSSFLDSKGYETVNYTDDINDLAGLENYFKGVDFVIHLAAKCDKFRTGRENDDFIAVNVLGTKNVIELCLKYKCRLIYFSSISAKKHGDMYGLSKFFAEELVKFYTKIRGLLAVIIRPSGIYDENHNDRLGKPMDFSKGRHYPIAYLSRDVEKIIRSHHFDSNCRIYTTRLFFNYHVWYWFKRIRNKISKSISQIKL